MFAQFRSQYPQGRIQTEMLPKIDGLHAFRAIVSEGDAIMGTATAVDSDLEIAEDRAVKRALAIAGLAFDNSFDHNYGNYGGRSPMVDAYDHEDGFSFRKDADLEGTGSEFDKITPELGEIPINKPIPSKASAPQISPEPVDLSDAISKIDVEMERLSWTKTQGRDYLVRSFDKKSRQQLTNDELLQFLSHLKSLPTPHRQLANDDFF